MYRSIAKIKRLNINEFILYFLFNFFFFLLFFFYIIFRSKIFFSFWSDLILANTCAL